jgi:glycosyltransferase involved in cell wall biosynthesis
MERKKILWLTSWYPNKIDRFDGDFIQRHAHAAAIYDDIHVIFVTGASQTTEEFHYVTGLTEQIIYYKEQASLFRWIKKQYSFFIYFKKAIQAYIQKNGLPHCVHVHIPWKAGLLALWMKKKYKTPYLVTEHWGIYNTIEKENIQTKSFINKASLKAIFQQAYLFISVSRFLGEGVNSSVVKKEYITMHNVVDTTLFHFAEKEGRPFTFIHVSNGAAIKNIKGILEAFAGLAKKKKEVRLLIVGTKQAVYRKQAQELNLLNINIFFIGEVPYQQVAEEMKTAHAFVLFSYMENSPCVIGEALCCGMPIITANVGGVAELVDETNSVLVKSADNHELTVAMEQVIETYKNFDRKEIADRAKNKFSYNAISQQFRKIYSSMGSST